MEIQAGIKFPCSRSSALPVRVQPSQDIPGFPAPQNGPPVNSALQLRPGRPAWPQALLETTCGTGSLLTIRPAAGPVAHNLLYRGKAAMARIRMKSSRSLSDRHGRKVYGQSTSKRFGKETLMDRYFHRLWQHLCLRQKLVMPTVANVNGMEPSFTMVWYRRTVRTRFQFDPQNFFRTPRQFRWRLLIPPQ